MLHYVRFFACSFLNFFLLLLWNFFLSKSFWGKFAQWTIFLLFRFIKYCVDDLLKIYYFKPKIKKSNHSSTHSISISYYCFIKTRMESPSSRASPQINIDKDIYEKQNKNGKLYTVQSNGRRVWHQNDVEIFRLHFFFVLDR